MAIAQRLERLSSAWQIPLFVFSAAMLVAGLLELRPAVPVLTFEERLETARLLQQSGQYALASKTLAELLTDADLAPVQRASVHRMLGQTIWLAESSRRLHDPENAKRIIKNYETALALTGALVADEWYRVAQAADWLGQVDKAVEAYRKALALGFSDRAPVRKRLIELMLSKQQRDWAEIDEQIETLLAEASDRPEILVEAAKWKVHRCLATGRRAEAQRTLDALTKRLDIPPWSYHLEYLRALLAFYQDRLAEAEASLRALRSHLRRSDPLYGQAGWLLGRISLAEDRPQIALSFFEEVVRTQAGSEYWLASIVGKAEALAALHRYAEAANAYQQAIDALRRFKGSLLVDRAVIRESLRSLAWVLSQTGRPDEALPFVASAITVASGEPSEVIGSLLELEARIHLQIAKNCESVAAALRSPGVSAATMPTSRPSPESLEERARRHYEQAGETMLRLAQISVFRPELAEESVWRAAVCFDKAGLIDKSIRTLKEFLREYSSSAHCPEAMRRLAQSLQALGRYEEAIEWYRDLRARFARTPAALASLVPLARCYIALGKAHYGDAEKVLLSVVEEDPKRPPLFEPTAPEFREALIELANLYIRWDRPERAIERLEQVISLYPDDPRVTRLKYLLADAYRRSGLALKQQGGKISQPMQAEIVRREAVRRLSRARVLFDEVVAAFEQKPNLSPVEQTCLKASYLFRADCAFDLGDYDLAARLYGQVAWRWQGDPLVLSAYLQIIRCHLAQGNVQAARTALARARWMLQRIPDAAFKQDGGIKDRAYWQNLFDWIEASGLVGSGNQALTMGAK